MDTSATVVGRTVHWICQQPTWTPGTPRGDMFILALLADDDAAMATVAIAPPECCRRMWASSAQLAVSADGKKLGLVVAEESAGIISMWTLQPAEGWTRQVVVSMDGIIKQVVMTPGAGFQSGFGERSGAVLFWMDKVGLVQLNVATKKVVVVLRCGEGDTSGVERAFLHEINLASLLQGMKQF